MIRPMDVTPEMIEARQALAFVRSSDDRYNQWSPLGNAIRILEETGVFAEIDEVIDSDKIPELLAEGAARDLAEAHGARDHEIRTPLDYVRAVNDAQGELDAGDRAAMGRLARRAFRLNNPGA